MTTKILLITDNLNQQTFFEEALADLLRKDGELLIASTTELAKKILDAENPDLTFINPRFVGEFSLNEKILSTESLSEKKIVDICEKLFGEESKPYLM